MKWTDENIDKLFQEGAGKLSFDYKPEYWNDFEQSLPSAVPASDLTDEEIDALFKEEAAQVSVNYKPEFWEEFSESLPIIVPTEEVTDAEVDALYRQSVDQLAFEYKHSYWEEMAALLSRRRRPDFLWFGFSSLFAIGLVLCMFVDQHPLNVRMTGIDVELPGNGPLTASNGTETPTSTPSNSTNVINGSQANNAAAPVQNATNSVTPTVNQSSFVEIVENPTQPTSTPVNNQEPRINGPLDVTDPVLPLTSVSTPTSTEQSTNEETTDISWPAPLQPFGATPLATDRASLAEVNTNYPGLPRGIEIPRFGMYVQGIGGLSQSPISPSTSLSNSVGVGTGILVHKRFLTYNVGANFLLENHNDLTLTRTAKNYGLGSTVYRFDLEYRQLYSVELDLGVGYNLGRHQFRVGVRPSLAVGSKLSVTQTTITSTKGETVENKSNRVAPFNTLDGIQRFGVKPMIGYAYNFRGGWTLGANFGAELLPSIKEEYIVGTNKTPHFDGQLYLRKSFNFTK